MIFFYRAHVAPRERVWDALERWALELVTATSAEPEVAALLVIFAGAVATLSSWQGTAKGTALEIAWLMTSWVVDGARWAWQAVPMPVQLGIGDERIRRVRWLGWVIDWNGGFEALQRRVDMAAVPVLTDDEIAVLARGAEEPPPC